MNFNDMKFGTRLGIISTEQVPIDFENALKALEGNAGVLEKIAQLLLSQIDVDLVAIQIDVAAEDSAALADSSHRLKGSLGVITAVPAYLACTALNKSARGGAFESYGPELARLEHEISRLRPFLQAWLIEQAK
jgi:HPt (histidine-containing phosphotransfer) domain-containing protein